VDIQRPDVPPLDVPDGIAPESVVEPLNDGFASDSGVVAFDDVNSAIVMDAPPPPPAPPSQRAISHVGGNIRPPQKIVDVAPVYPLIARAAHVGGVVILEAVIAEDGSVRDVNVLRSIPLLDAAAVEAVRQWRFSPTLLNGEPVPIVMTVTVAFRLH